METKKRIDEDPSPATVVIGNVEKFLRDKIEAARGANLTETNPDVRLVLSGEIAACKSVLDFIGR